MTVMTRVFRVSMLTCLALVPWLCLSVRTSLQGFWTECFVTTGGRCKFQDKDGRRRCSWGSTAGCTASWRRRSTGDADTLAHRAPLGLPLRSSCCHGFIWGSTPTATWTVASPTTVASTTPSSWTSCSAVPMATSLDVLSLLVLISVLLLLVVDTFRKVREYPLVMRNWWAFSAMDSSCTSMTWTMFYDMELITLLLHMVVVMLRKGREYPLCCATGGLLLRLSTTFCSRCWDFPGIVASTWTSTSTWLPRLLRLCFLPRCAGLWVRRCLRLQCSWTSSTTRPFEGFWVDFGENLLWLWFRGLAATRTPLTLGIFCSL